MEGAKKRNDNILNNGVLYFQVKNNVHILLTMNQNRKSVEGIPLAGLSPEEGKKPLPCSTVCDLDLRE